MYLDLAEGNYLTDVIKTAYVENPNVDVQQINIDKYNIITENSQEMVYQEYRYIGPNPNNYVWFNCDERYPVEDNNQNALHCEKWRIIGIMDSNTTGESEPLLKIVRDSIGTFSFDSKQNGVGSSISDNGSNDWSDSQLMMMLNPAKYLNHGYRLNNGTVTNTKYIHGRTYEIDVSTGKVYYTKSDGTTQSVMQMTYNSNTEEWAGAYYNRANGCKPVSTSVGEEYVCNAQNFSTTGLRDEAKKYIQVLNWKLGGHSTSAVTTENMYKYERGTTVPNDRPTTWYGEIGLMYPTEFAMATGLGLETTDGNENYCKDITLNSWSLEENINCINGNWLKSRSLQWTITSRSDNGHYVFQVSDYLYKNGLNSGTYAVRPTLYLKSSTLVKDGNGSVENPYQLML